jgi:hypothetical protein
MDAQRRSEGVVAMADQSFAVERHSILDGLDRCRGIIASTVGSHRRVEGGAA